MQVEYATELGRLGEKRFNYVKHESFIHSDDSHVANVITERINI